MFSLIHLLLYCFAALNVFVVNAAYAQAYPNKAINLIVPAAVGTPVEIISRIMAKHLSAELKQPIIVNPKPGATGTIGAQEVLRQPADGYTLMTLYMPMTVAQTLYKTIPFNLHRDFVSIGQTAWSYNVLVVYPAVSAKSALELATILKTHPGELNFSSGGIGTPAHISGELFKQQIGASALHVPYNQFSQAIVDLVSGRNQFMFAATPAMVQYVASGRVRALAVTGPKRIEALRDIPTMVEAGFPNFVVSDWQGIVAKTGTPQLIIDTVNTALNKVLVSEQFKDALASLGADPAPGTPEQFKSLIDSEVVRWGVVTKKGGLKLD